MNRPTVVRQEIANRPGEQGVTLIVVAVALVATLGMAALAIDLTSLYVSHEQAQRAADAAALAGAKTFVTSGFTAGQISEGSACISSTGVGSGAANLAAQAAATANLVSGTAPQIVSVACNYASSGGDQNPQITVKVQQTNLPSYFTKYWGESVNSVTATSTAEAYNPSGPNGVSPVQVSIKPFLVPNCIPTTGLPKCASSQFINPANSNNLINQTSYLGQEFYFAQLNTNNVPAATPPSAYAGYYVVTPPKEATICPAASAGACSQVGTGGLNDNIACSEEPTRLPPPTADEGEQLSCGDKVNVAAATGVSPDPSITSSATQCLIHAGGTGLGTGQDIFTPPNGFTLLSVEIDAGTNNPNQTFATAQTKNISRSDSIVSVPLYDSSTTSACAGGTCSAVQVIGFLQLGIEQSYDAKGTIRAIVINASGCGSSIPAAEPAVSAQGVSSVPVRLITASGP